MKQLQIDFNPDIYSQYSSCLEFIADQDIPRVCRDKKILKKSIAADMDYSPSNFSNKIYQSGDHRFSLDDLELYIRVTGSIEPVKYLVSKYLNMRSREDMKKEFEELKKLLEQEEGEIKKVA